MPQVQASIDGQVQRMPHSMTARARAGTAPFSRGSISAGSRTNGPANVCHFRQRWNQLLIWRFENARHTDRS